MESASTPMPTARPNRYSTFHQSTSLLRDQNMEKYQHYINVQGEVLPTPHGTATAAKTSK